MIRDFFLRFNGLISSLKFKYREEILYSSNSKDINTEYFRWQRSTGNFTRD